MKKNSMVLTSTFQRLLNLRYLTIITSIIYIFSHIFFYSHTEWLNTDYERQIYSVANTTNWFFIEGEFSSRVPPVLPIVYGLLLKLSKLAGIDIYLLGKLLNLSFIFVNAYLLYKISSQLVNGRLRLFAPFFYLLNPIILYYSFKPLSEHLFMLVFFFFLHKIILYLKNADNGSLVSAMFAYSLSLLIRPTYLYFTVFLFAFLIYHNRRQLTTLLVPALVWCITLLPWTSYSYVSSGKIVISSTGSIQSLKDGIAYDNKGYRGEVTSDPEIRKVMDDFWKDYSSFSSAKQVYHFYVDQLQTNSWGLIKFQTMKIFRVFIGTDTINKKFEALMFMVNLPIILMLLFWIYRFVSKPSRSRIDFFFLVLIFYTILISSIVVPLFRYLLPIFYIIPIFTFSEFRNSFKHA